MAQASAASATAAAVGDEDDIGARISRLGLPAKPNVIGRASPHPSCSHHHHCYCNIYTTMRADLPNIESPDREVGGDRGRVVSTTPNRGSVKPPGTNMMPKTNPGKKLSWTQYRKMTAANGSGLRESKSPVNREKRLIVCHYYFRVGLIIPTDRSSGLPQMLQ